MRTVIAPLGAVVENDLAELDARSAEVARRFIRRLRLERELGAPAARGALGVLGARRVYFDASSRPDDLFAAPSATRRGDRDLIAGPKLRIVYWAAVAPRAGVRVVIVLAVGEAHPQPPQRSVYEAAEERLLRLTERRTR